MSRSTTSGDIEGRLFIDMRLIDGGDLVARAAGQPMPAQRAVAIIVQVCDALANAHAQGIVHRDVKTLLPNSRHAE